MRGFLPCGTAGLALVVWVAGAERSVMTAQPAPNTLTAAEKADGWRLLFDGETLTGWRAFKADTQPAGWKAVEGTLSREGGGGDTVTVEQFGDFELRLDWKLAKGGNSGIMFRVTQEGASTYETGPEFQVLDNAGHDDGGNSLTSAGSNYALHAPVRDVTRPIGEWNEVRLVVNGAHVEHWMNGVKLLEYELWSDDWNERVKASKFNKMPHYGRAKRGHIALQDHGDPVWFRNVRIRPLNVAGLNGRW